MIVVAGSLSFDYIFNFPGKFVDHIMPDKIHLLNLSFLTDRMNKNYGGTAGNIAYNLGLLKAEPVVLATAGRDFAEYKDFLEGSGVDTSQIKIYKNKLTSNYFVLVDQLDNQIGGFYSGAMAEADKLSLASFKQPIKMVIISPTKPEAMIKFSRECRQRQIPFMFDPGMQLPRLKKDQLISGIKGAKVLIGNDYEISLIIKKTRLAKKDLLEMTDILITTLGEAGSRIETKNKKIKVGAARIKVNKDPVGAGDAYRAGFAAGFLSGQDLKTCGQMAGVCASYTVEKYGTTTHQFSLAGFQERYADNFQSKIEL